MKEHANRPHPDPKVKGWVISEEERRTLTEEELQKKPVIRGRREPGLDEDGSS